MRSPVRIVTKRPSPNMNSSLFLSHTRRMPNRSSASHVWLKVSEHLDKAWVKNSVEERGLLEIIVENHDLNGAVASGRQNLNGGVAIQACLRIQSVLLENLDDGAADVSIVVDCNIELAGNACKQ